MSQFTPNKANKDYISALENLGRSPEQVDFLVGLSPEEFKEAREHLMSKAQSCLPTTTAGAAAKNNDIERSTKRHDLSCQYLSGSGETPAALLQKGIDAIIEEHETAGDECPHNSNVAAPLLCLLQSTGYGKTRALLELAKENKNPVVYLPF
jgi:hypothetical protein